MQKFISLTKIVAINLFVLLLLLFFTSYACRFVLRKSAVNRADLPNYENDPELANDIFADYAQVGHEYVPFLGWKTRPYKGKTLVIGSNGYRQVENLNKSAKNDTIPKLKVGFFGGSTLWGEGSPDDSTIPSLFAQLNPNCEVFNFGQLAFNSRQNLATLVNLYSSEINLDVVIFYDGVNDAAFLCPESVSVSGHRMEPVFKKRLYASNKYLIGRALYKYFVQDILIVTNLIREKYFGQKKQSEYTCYEDSDKIKSIADGLFNNWEIAAQIVKDNNGVFVGVLQPMAFLGSPNLTHLDNLDPNLDQSMNAVYSNWLKKLESEPPSWVINLTESFDGDEYIYIDFCHVSPNGNTIISKKISEFVNQKDYLNPLNTGLLND